MPTFRKKPVEIQAILCSDAYSLIEKKSTKSLPKWFKDALESDPKTIVAFTHPSRVEIVTLEGTMVANSDDWIIQGVKGEIYPCKPDIFEATYDSVKG